MFNKLISDTGKETALTQDLLEAHTIAENMRRRTSSECALILETLHTMPHKANMVLGMLDPKFAGTVLAKCTPAFCERFWSATELNGKAFRLEFALGPDTVTLFLRTDPALWTDLINTMSEHTASFLINHICWNYREHVDAMRAVLLALPQRKRTLLAEHWIDGTVLPLLFNTFNTFQFNTLLGVNDPNSRLPQKRNY